jgi:hypothetical protein
MRMNLLVVESEVELLELFNQAPADRTPPFPKWNQFEMVHTPFADPNVPAFENGVLHVPAKANRALQRDLWVDCVRVISLPAI